MFSLAFAATSLWLVIASEGSDPTEAGSTHGLQLIVQPEPSGDMARDELTLLYAEATLEAFPGTRSSVPLRWLTKSNDYEKELAKRSDAANAAITFRFYSDAAFKMQPWDLQPRPSNARGFACI